MARWALVALALYAVSPWLAAGLAAGLGAWEIPEVRVAVPADTLPDEVRRRVDRAILEAEGRALGGVRADHVVRARLAMNLRFLRGEAAFAEEEVPVATEAELSEALALGLDRHDPVIAARLVELAEERLFADISATDPGDATLESFMRAHPSRHRRPSRVRFEERFFSRALRADPEGDARASLSQGDLGDPRVLTLGDRGTTLAELSRRLGPGVGEAVGRAPRGVWSAPIRSGFGVHLVRVIERSEGELPRLRHVRAAVLAAWRARRKEMLRPERLAALRSRYRVVVQETPR